MKKILNLLILVIFIGVGFYSCSKDDDDSLEESQKYKPVQTLTKDFIKGSLSNMGLKDLADEVKYDVSVYKYTYNVAYKGEEITASGLIGVPISQNNFPMLSFQHGTLVAKSEAPTIDVFGNTMYTMSAALGYVVVLPDLLGFGSSEDVFHPYLVKEPNVLAISEMINSVKAIPDGELGGVTINDSLFLLGYSQGGWLTLSQLERMEQQDDLGMDIIAASCGAGPYKPEQVMKYSMNLDTYEKPYYLAYVFLSFVEEGYITSSLSTYFQEPYATDIPLLFDGTNSGNQIDAELTTSMANFYDTEFLNDYSNPKYDELKTALNTNSISAWKNITPILFTHGESDIYVPTLTSDSIYSAFLNVGSQNVNLSTYPGLDHTTAAIPSIAEALEWFATFRSSSNTIAYK